MTHPLEHHLKQHWGAFANQRCVVAVSGGPDSLALLYALTACFSPHTLHLYHLDHGFRGAQSAAEAEFVHQTAHQLGISHTIEHADIPAETTARNINEAGRLVRYRRLAACAAQQEAAYVLVAHTRDDQVETVLMHLLRGSGSTGLAGMLPRIPWAEWVPDPSLIHSGHAQLVRPLLDIDRATIIDYCAARTLTPTADPSNTKLSSQRIRLRSDIIPRLRREQPQLNAIVARTAMILAEQSAALEQRVTSEWQTLCSQEAHASLLNRTAVAALPVALQRIAIRRACALHYPHLRDLHWEHVEAMRQSLLTGTPLTMLPPSPYQVRLHPAGLLIGPGNMPETAPPQYDGVALPLTAGTHITCGAFHLHCTSVAHAPASHPWQVALQPDQTYVMRNRHPGERMAINQHQHRRLQDIMLDAKIPAAHRSQWPIVATPAGAVWVVGVRVDPTCVAPVGMPALLCTVQQNQV